MRSFFVRAADAALTAHCAARGSLTWLSAIALLACAGCASVAPPAERPLRAKNRVAAPGLELGEVADRRATLAQELRELADPRYAASAQATIAREPELAHRLFFELEDAALHTALLHGYRLAGEPLYAESERVRRLNPSSYHRAVAALTQARDAVSSDPGAARAILERVDALEDPLLVAERGLIEAALRHSDGEPADAPSGGTGAQRAWAAWLGACDAWAHDALDASAMTACSATLRELDAAVLGERAEALREWQPGLPADREWLVWLSERALERRATLGALRFAQRAGQQGADVEVSLLRARCLRKAGRLDAAQSPLDEAHRLAAGPAERGAVEAERGRVLLALGEGEDAAQAFQAARSAALEAGDERGAQLRALDRCAALLQGYELAEARATLPVGVDAEVRLRADALRALLELAENGDTVAAAEQLVRAAEAARTLGRPRLATRYLKLRARVLNAS